MTLYNVGSVTITKNSTRVIGKNTSWMSQDVKSNDLFILNGKVLEIEKVISSTEILLSQAYTGDSIEDGKYIIIRVAEQVLAADLAKKIQELVENYNEREKELGSLAKVWKLLGLFINSDGFLCQSEKTLDDIDVPESDLPVASDDEIDSMIDQILPA